MWFVNFYIKIKSVLKIVVNNIKAVLTKKLISKFGGLLSYKCDYYFIIYMLKLYRINRVLIISYIIVVILYGFLVFICLNLYVVHLGRRGIELRIMKIEPR